MSIRWGIAGPGRISRTIAEEFAAVDDAEVVAVGSRSIDHAREFAEQYSIPRAHGSYRELVDDPEVDAIYFGTPNAQHYAMALAAIEAGKAVLVEKSMTCQPEHTRELIEAVHAKGVFAMEGMWTRFLPAVRAAHDAIDAGRIGEVKAVQGDLFAYREFDPSDRLFGPAQGGGAMLDLGVYVLHFAQDFLGAPAQVQTTGWLTPNGVDAGAAMQLSYESGATAQVSCSLQAYGPGRMIIAGSEGFIEVGPRFHHPSTIVVHHGDDDPETITLPFPGVGYQVELAAVTQAIAEGKTEHPLVPLSDSLDVSLTMANALDQLGYQPVDDTEF